MADASLLSLSADEQRYLAATLRAVIDEDRYPLSPRVVSPGRDQTVSRGTREALGDPADTSPVSAGAKIPHY